MADYGLMPWDVDRLRFPELKALIEAQDARAKAIKHAQAQQQRGGGRGRGRR